MHTSGEVVLCCSHRACRCTTLGLCCTNRTDQLQTRWSGIGAGVSGGPMMADAVRVGRRREGAALSHPQNRHEAEGGGQPCRHRIRGSWGRGRGGRSGAIHGARGWPGRRGSGCLRLGKAWATLDADLSLRVRRQFWGSWSQLRDFNQRLYVVPRFLSLHTSKRILEMCCSPCP